MRNKVVTLVIVSALLFALAVPSAIAQAMGTAPTATQHKPMAAAQGGRHPQIEKAIKHLEETKQFLLHDASNDLEGHKHAAIQNIDEALRHLHQAMEVVHNNANR